MKIFIIIAFICTIRVNLHAEDPNNIKKAYIYGEGSFPKLGEDCSISGNRELINQLEKIAFTFENDIPVKDAFLSDLVAFMNKSLPVDTGWKIAVQEDAKRMLVSGSIKKSLIDSLVALMKNSDFHCEITDGIVTLKKGKNQLGK